MALGALKSCTRPPAAAGPAIATTASLVESLLLASTNSLFSTSAGSTEMAAIWKKTVKVPAAKVTIQICRKERFPNQAAAGTEASSSARPRSAHTNIGRRRTLSTQTPAKRPNSRLGSEPAATSRPISEGVAPSTSTAVRGRATVVMAVPAPDVTCATHSRVNARFFQRLPDCFICPPTAAPVQGRARSNL